jgi:hypothetical protein
MSDEFAVFDGYDPTDDPDPIDDPTVTPESGADQGERAAPTTGHARVDAATALLDDLQELPTAEHVDLFDDVHRRLQGALSDLDGA